ncbi:MAG TPA: DUF2158 domain-containing protein [Caulobacteraceae bacterium]|jgi:uncharacterized protein YodC (DUF2158 family)|nr:DUF2158 domain-containing protein [Caulobacteraceae bacterium]
MGGEAWTARAGDAVRLKSGGVVMTAERVNHEAEHPVARCVWFIGLDALELAIAEDSAST